MNSLFSVQGVRPFRPQSICVVVCVFMNLAGCGSEERLVSLPVVETETETEQPPEGSGTPEISDTVEPSDATETIEPSDPTETIAEVPPERPLPYRYLTPQLLPISGFIDSESGGNHSCALDNNGTLMCWGINSDGQIGDATTGSRRVPVPVAMIDNVSQFSLGDYHSCALSEGTVYCWGSSYSGQVGAGRTSDATAPTEVLGVDAGIQVAVGALHSCAVTTTGTVFCWGDNGSGQLGRETRSYDSEAGRVSRLVVLAVEVALGFEHTCAVLVDGTVMCWGGNQHGQLGNGNTINQTNPVPVSGLENVASLSVGEAHACAVLDDSSVQCWGDNRAGQLGVGGITASSTPVVVEGLTDIVQVAAGEDHTCARQTDGVVLCWGGNVNGQLGDGTQQSRFTPMPVEGLTDVTDIAASWQTTQAVTATGQVYTFGVDHYRSWRPWRSYESIPRPMVDVEGALAVSAGVGHTCLVQADTSVSCLRENSDSSLGSDFWAGTARFMTDVANISSSWDNTCVVRTGGTAACFGANTFGQLALPAGVAQDDAVSVGGLGELVDVQPGMHHTCGLVADGTVHCWGENDFGQLGDGTRIDRWQHAQVEGLENIVELGMGDHHSCVRDADGQVFCWGENDFGQLGLGHSWTRLRPEQVVSLPYAVQLAGGYNFTCAVVEEGAVYCWGSNDRGQLGDWTTTDRPIPTQVRGVVGATRVATGYDTACAVLEDTTVVCWGDNANAQVGDGTAYARRPQASTVMELTGAVDVTVGESHACALREDGDVFCWGNVSSTRTPEEDTGSDRYSYERSALATAQTLGELRQLASNGRTFCAVDATGIVYCWGSSYNGETGQGDDYDVSYPGAVFGPTDVAEVAVGMSHVCAREQGGAVWCWGENSSGQIGDGTTTTRLEATQITAFDDAIDITSGGSHSCAILSDGTLQCWGDNGSGQLGDGSETSRANPVVVSLTQPAVQVVAGSSFTCVLDNTSAVRCWGSNWEGQLGTEGYGADYPPVYAMLTDVTQLACGNNHTCALMADQTVNCWGANRDGQLGDGLWRNHYVPTPVFGLDSVQSIVALKDMTCAARTDGQVLCWGSNRDRVMDIEIGNTPRPTLVLEQPGAQQVVMGSKTICVLNEAGVTTCQTNEGDFLYDYGDRDRTVPIEVAGLTDVTSIALGENHTCAVRTDGMAFCWGDNRLGQLGDGTQTSRDWVQPVVGVSNVAELALGETHTCALTHSGDVLCWGENDAYHLGSTVSSPQTAPTHVMGLNQISEIAAGLEHTCALRIDGIARCWGGCSLTQCGETSRWDPVSSPQVVAGFLDGVSIDSGDNHTCVVRRSGAVWCWGSNNRGQIGDGTSGYYERGPSAVLDLTDATALFVGANSSCAQQTDDSVLCWGDNYRGQISSGAEEQLVEPSDYWASGTVVQVALGGNHGCALLDDGTVWCAGAADNGQLGRETEGYETRWPGEVVPSLSGVTQIGVGDKHTCALVEGGTVLCWGNNMDGQLGGGTNPSGASLPPVAPTSLPTEP